MKLYAIFVREKKMRSMLTLACAALLFTTTPSFSEISREHMFRFCEHERTMEVADIAVQSVRLLGEKDGAQYYRGVVKKVYERTSDSEWRWIELAHERILEAVIYYRAREGRFMVKLDRPFIIDSCKLAIPSR